MEHENDHEALRLAIVGMRRALQRCEVASDSSVRDADGGALSAVEFVHWACAVDEQLWSVEGYEEERDQCEPGKTVSGFRFVRDRHTHQVVVSNRNTTAIKIKSFFQAEDGRVPVEAYSVTWLPAHRIKAGDRKRKDYATREAAYGDHIADRPLPEPMKAALDWLTPHVKALGVLIDPEDASPVPEHDLPPGWHPIS